MKMLQNLSTILFSQLFETIFLSSVEPNQIAYHWVVFCVALPMKEGQVMYMLFFLLTVRTAEFSPLKASYSFDKDLQQENHDQLCDGCMIIPLVTVMFMALN